MPDAYVKARRAQSIIDIFASVFAAMMVWPFPIARATLSPQAHVIGVLVTCVLLQGLYFSVCAVVWRQTLGMRLTGLMLSAADAEPLRRRQALIWGLISALTAMWFAVAPTSACSAATAERASGAAVG